MYVLPKQHCISVAILYLIPFGAIKSKLVARIHCTD